MMKLKEFLRLWRKENRTNGTPLQDGFHAVIDKEGDVRFMSASAEAAAEWLREHRDTHDTTGWTIKPGEDR